MNIILRIDVFLNTVLFPVSNTIALILLVYGAINTDFRKPFSALAAATALLLPSQYFYLLAGFQHTFGIHIIANHTGRVFHIITALLGMASFPMYIIGIFLLVKSAMEKNQ